MALKISDIVSAGMNGGVFITDITPLNDNDNIGNKVFSMDGKALDSCTTDTLSMEVQVLAFTGNTNYTPNVKVKGTEVTNLNEIDNNGIFTGSINITISELEERITATHEDGAVDSVDINYIPKPEITNAYFTGGYPTNQTELKENDTFDLYVQANNEFKELEIADESAFKGLVLDSINSERATVTGIIADRGNTSIARYAKVRVKDTNNSWSEWYRTDVDGTEDGVNVVMCNNLKPTININAINYPENQEAIKNDEIVTIDHDIENWDYVDYTSPNDQVKRNVPVLKERNISRYIFDVDDVPTTLFLSDDGYIYTINSDGLSTKKPIGNDFIQVAAGSEAAIALKEDGSIVGWGEDDLDYILVTDAPTENDHVQISADSNYAVALKEDGSLVSWGHDNFNQVSETPTDNNFVEVDCGSSHAVALTEDGSIVAWGEIYVSEYNGESVFTYLPANEFVPEDDGYVMVSAGYDFCLALKEDGTLVSWGENGHNDIIDDTPTDGDYISIATGKYHALALKKDGTIVSWGETDYGLQRNSPISDDFIQIYAGKNNSCAIQYDGTVVIWGYGHRGTTTLLPRNIDISKYERLWDAPTVIDSGNKHSCALFINGYIDSWGDDDYGQVSDTPKDKDFKEISCGDNFSVALNKNGSISVWGDDSFGQITDKPDNENIEKIYTKRNTIFAITEDNEILCWGEDGDYILSKISDNNLDGKLKCISYGTDHIIGINKNGELIGFGDDTHGQISNIPQGNKFVQVVSTQNTSLALEKNGNIHVWGEDSNGLVSNAPLDDIAIYINENEGNFVIINRDYTPYVWGDDKNDQVSTFNNIDLDSDVKQITLGTNYGGSIVKSDGGLLSWNIDGTSEDYIYNNVSLPNDTTNQVKDTPQVGFKDVVSCDVDSVAIRYDGSLIGWGDNINDRIYPLPEDYFNQIDLSKICGVGVKKDGALSFWGDPGIWELDDIPTGNDFIKAQVSGAIGVALKEDGSLVAWGNGDDDSQTHTSGADFISPVSDINDIVDFEIYYGVGSQSSYKVGFIIREDGSLLSWGSDSGFGVLSNTPSDGDYIKVQIAYKYTIALKDDGTITAWGDDSDEFVSDAPTDDGFIDISTYMEYPPVALKEDGYRTTWGNTYRYNMIEYVMDDYNPGDQYKDFLESKIISILRDEYTYTLINDVGQIKTIGYDMYRKSIKRDTPSFYVKPIVPEDYKSIQTHELPRKVAAGDNVTLAIRNNGSIIGWGDDTFNLISDIPSGNDFKKIVVSKRYACALRTNGSIVTWGDNADPAELIKETPTGCGFQEIDMANGIGIGIRHDNSFIIWGRGNDSNIYDEMLGYYDCDEWSISHIAISDSCAIVFDILDKMWRPIGVDTNGLISDAKSINNGVLRLSLSSTNGAYLEKNGYIRAWGDDSYNQESEVPSLYSSRGYYKDVVCGENYIVALNINGEIEIFGDDDSKGIISNIPNDTDFISIDAGKNHVVALRKDGKIFTWGQDNNGSVSDIPDEKDFVIAGEFMPHFPTGIYIPNVEIKRESGDYNVTENNFRIYAKRNANNFEVIKDDIINIVNVPAEIEVREQNENIKSLPDGNDVLITIDSNQKLLEPPTLSYTDKIHPAERPLVIASGLYHTLALKSDGSLISWGEDDDNLISDTPTGNVYTQIAAQDYNSAALREDGSIVIWGDNSHNQITDTPTGNDFVRVACGTYHLSALKEDGTVVSWGQDNLGQVSDTPSGNDFVQVSCGVFHSVALKEDGSIVSWGYDVYNQISDTPTGNDFIHVACGSYHSLALKEDGSIVSWGYDMDNQITDTPTGNDFAQISGGQYYSAALKEDGSIVVWGSDDYNQLSDTPSGNDFVQVSCGLYHIIALKEDGTLVSWGDDKSDYGEVSDTPTSDEFYHYDVGLPITDVWVEDSFQGGPSIWNRNMKITDEYPKGTHEWVNLHAKGLSGIITDTITGDNSYTVAGFKEREITFPPFNRQVDIGTNVTDPYNVVCTDMSGEKFSYQQDKTNSKWGFTIVDSDGTPNPNGRYIYITDDDWVYKNSEGLAYIIIKEI